MNNKKNKLIINLAVTGAIPTKQMTRYVPISPEEIIAEVNLCASMGVSIVHLHARDQNGYPIHNKEVFASIIAGIRNVHPDLIIGVTTSGRTYRSFKKRAEVLGLSNELKPDMASLTLSSLNFNKSACINSPEMIVKLAETMRAKDIKPELEVFDLGMVNYAHYLIKKEVLTPPYYFNILLGNNASAQAKLLHLGLLVSELPDQSFWSVTGIGSSQLDMNAIGIIMADGVRVGLEDNIWYDQSRTRLASNNELVQRIITIAAAIERSIATPLEVRKLLGLQRHKQ